MQRDRADMAGLSAKNKFGRDDGGVFALQCGGDWVV